MIPLIAIIGRPNVGKSTFFNRLLNQREAIVDSQEGITRDRNYGLINWCGHSLRVIDTGGFIPKSKSKFNSAVRHQANEAILESDLILFMVDGKQGPTSTDKDIAQFIRKSSKPYLLAVNKCDGYGTDALIHQFHEIGLSNPVPLSALNGRLTGNLLDRIILLLDFPAKNFDRIDHINLKLAIVGMPNVGKSTLTNALLKEERMIVTPIAGTTRDAVDVDIKYYGQNITLVDTAGMRKLAKIKDKIEYYSILRTKNAIDRSNVVLVLIDAEKGFGKQDKRIVDEVIGKGKGLVLIINKWDLVNKSTDTMKDYQQTIQSHFKSIVHYPVLFISALTKQRIHKVLDLSLKVYEKGQNMLPTNILNKTLKDIISRNTPPLLKGKTLDVKYVSQVSCEPTVIALYTSSPKSINTSYQRYLENSLRKSFDLKGIPIRLSFRKK